MTPDGWQEYPLGAFMARLTRKNVELNDNVLTVSAERGLVSQEKYFNKRVASKNLRNYSLLERGDFVYSKSYSKGYPVGAIKRLDAYHKGIVSPLYICLELADPKVVSSDFLAQLFESGILDKQIRLIAKEGGRAHGLLNVKPSEFLDVVGILPPLPEQRKIAAILSSVDDTIEKTQAVIDQVQVVKRGLMQELLTRGLPGRHKKFKKTEIGEIPETWNYQRLTDLSAFVTSGSRGWAKYYSSSGALFIRSQNVRRGHLDFVDRQSVSAPEGAEGKRTAVAPGDVLITITGNSVGNVACVEGDVGEAYVSQHVGLVRLANPSMSKYVALYLAPGAPGNRQIGAAQYGQSKPGLNLGNIRDLKIAIPPDDEREQVVEALDGVDRRWEVELLLLRQAGRLKSALMSVLLTGEVRIQPDPEAA